MHLATCLCGSCQWSKRRIYLCFINLSLAIWFDLTNEIWAEMSVYQSWMEALKSIVYQSRSNQETNLTVFWIELSIMTVLNYDGHRHKGNSRKYCRDEREYSRKDKLGRELPPHWNLVGEGMGVAQCLVEKFAGLPWPEMVHRHQGSGNNPLGYRWTEADG